MACHQLDPQGRLCWYLVSGDIEIGWPAGPPWAALNYRQGGSAVTIVGSEDSQDIKGTMLWQPFE
jgi:hypothetical protein